MEFFTLKYRVAAVFLVTLFFALLAVGRSIQLQLLPNDKLKQLSQTQYQAKVELLPKRGIIYDRHGTELAISLDVASVYVHPHRLENKRAVAKKLAPFMGLSSTNLLKKFSTKKRFIWLKRRLPFHVGEQIKKMSIPGVGVIPEGKRFYPHQQLASHVLGFVGLDSRGLEGVELRYDSSLLGQVKNLQFPKDAHGRLLFLDGTVFTSATEGGILELTIDKEIQYIVERELEKTIIESQAKSGTVIVQIPETGEILALANFPTFDPNDFGRYSLERWRNRAVTDVYEPGSTFKVFVMAAALEAGVISENTRIYCEKGKWRVADRIITEAQGHKYEWLTAAEILKFSSNIGAAKVVQRLGRERLYDKLRAFGFGQKLSLQFPGEAEGIVRHWKDISKVGLATMAFGQGISITPLQLVTAFSALANGGNLMEPQVVRRIKNAQGLVLQEVSPKKIAQVVTPAVAANILTMLGAVTEEGGTGQAASVAGYRVAGKTGTAEKPNLILGGYEHDKYVTSFIGGIPGSAPQFSILVIIDEPGKGRYGGVVAAPTFKRIAEALVRHMKIAPENKILTSQKETESPAIEQGEAPTLPRLYGVGKMPNLVGLTLKEVLDLLKEENLDLQIHGSGVVIDQSPRPGVELKMSKKCILKLKPKI